jgi:hypothetical protein
MKHENDKRLVYFRGAKVRRREANAVGLALVFGIIGAFSSAILCLDGKVLHYLVIIAFALVGYSLGRKLK